MIHAIQPSTAIMALAIAADADAVHTKELEVDTPEMKFEKVGKYIWWNVAVEKERWSIGEGGFVPGQEHCVGEGTKMVSQCPSGGHCQKDTVPPLPSSPLQSLVHSFIAPAKF
ncbi:unnamed protein product [Sphenostylis stenocarpa]|uniref:Uncharacterized protein n=1 Tax=Sphenostylis stenocarpa TaxID=92480 RepID=A0AA86VGD6_9FABA|nr:unnamed protein product [Sphenostylis stenocarpa]